MRIVFIVGFILMAAAQWYAPISMIVKQEKALTGKEFHFKTRPVDPSDPFRGKYVTLSFDGESVTLPDTLETYEIGEHVFALLNTDSSGFAYIEQIMRYQPDYDKDFMTVEITQNYEKGMVRVQFPFERFYVEESKASEAEQLYWENNRMDTTSVCYGVVRVYLGEAALVDVMINDRPILDVVREMNRD